MRRIILSFIMILAICMMGFATPEKSYTFNEAYELMLKNNATLISINNQIKIADRLLYIANAAANSEQDRVYSSDKANYDSAIKRELNPISRKWDLERLKFQLENKKVDLQIDLSEQFIAMERQKNENQRITSSLKFATDELKQVQVKYDKGFATALQVAEKKQQLDELNTQLLINERQQKKVIVAINHLLGLPLDQSTLINNFPEYSVSIPVVDLQKLIAYNLEQSLDIQDKKNALDFKVLDFKIYKREIMFTEAKVSEAYENDIQTLTDAYDKAKSDLQLTITNDYLSLFNFEDSIAIRKLELETAIRNYDLAKAQQKLGIITQLQLQQIEDQYYNAQRAVSIAEFDLYEAITRFIFNYKVSEYAK